MNTFTIRILSDTYIFQKGNILEINGELITGVCDGEQKSGYFLPDRGDGKSGIIPADRCEFAAESFESAEYFGKCILTSVDNYDSGFGAEPGSVLTGEILLNHVNFVHYPDSQQLVFHMPEYAWDAKEIWLFDKVRDMEIFRAPVREKLNGGTMICLDTLPYKPGFYCLRANWPNGRTHEIHFIKMVPGFPFDATYQHPPGNLTMIQNEHEYRLTDSNSVEIADRFWRAAREIKALTHKRLEYHQDGRGGTIDLIDGKLKISFDWEFAGGNGVVIIFIPEPKYWEISTKTPLSDRQSILEFVGESVIRDKARGCYYQISDRFLEILRM